MTTESCHAMLLLSNFCFDRPKHSCLAIAKSACRLRERTDYDCWPVICRARGIQLISAFGHEIQSGKACSSDKVVGYACQQCLDILVDLSALKKMRHGGHRLPLDRQLPKK
jgi:hypothetical protein